jgi:predicted nucleic acid-binding protein
VIVDTTLWIDYLGGVTNPHTSWLDEEIPRQPLAPTDLILCEIQQGIRGNAAFADVQSELLQFHLFHPGGAELAIAAAQNYRLLRQRGHTVGKTIDWLIARFCLEEGHSLLHRDRDFDAFEERLGLSVVHP